MEYLQKSRFPFCKTAHLLVIILMFILVNGISCKKSISFLQDRSFTSNNFNVYTSKYNILQKRSFPFCKIAHLLVIILMFTLVNGISCKKAPFLFCKMFYLLVIILMFILVNPGISCKKVDFVFATKIIY